MLNRQQVKESTNFCATLVRKIAIVNKCQTHMFVKNKFQIYCEVFVTNIMMNASLDYPTLKKAIISTFFKISRETRNIFLSYFSYYVQHIEDHQELK